MQEANLFHGIKQADNPLESRRLWFGKKWGLGIYGLYLGNCPS